MPPPEFRFTTVSRADIPRLRAWLNQPHVRATWGEPEEEIALIEGDLGSKDCLMHVVHTDRPIGYIQNWGAHEGGVPHYGDLPPGTRSIDTFLGEVDCLGRGIAKAYVRQYADDLLDRAAPLVATDPRLDNPRGMALYRAAGFADYARRRCETGDMVQILTLAPSSGQ